MKSAPCWLAVLTLAYGSRATATETAQVIPTSYEAGHFYAVPETRDGQRLKLLVDTGGGGGSGMYWITAAAAQRLHLKTSTCMLGTDSATVAALPDYKSEHGLPPPLPGPCGKTLWVNPGDDVDGQLGAGYLPGRVWTFDYPARQLSVEEPTWRADASAHATPLGFQRNNRGALASGMARIVIRVDDQPLDMLLDTGATAHPTMAGEKASGTPTVNGIGVTSYIVTSQLERWHRAHPDWPIVLQGDDLFGPKSAMRMIQVPQVQIAGWSVGPVWFTERADINFDLHEGMSSYMDKQVTGAVGGNVFQHFVMTLDYPQRTAYFRCVSGCRAISPPAP